MVIRKVATLVGKVGSSSRLTLHLSFALLRDSKGADKDINPLRDINPGFS
jgi:hypothetical protein